MKTKKSRGFQQPDERRTIHAGEAFQVPPGHIAWVEEDARCILIDVGYSQYATAAKKKAA
jgi:quercetin dioxygenase-like cupin family protein